MHRDVKTKIRLIEQKSDSFFVKKLHSGIFLCFKAIPVLCCAYVLSAMPTQAQEVFESPEAQSSPDQDGSLTGILRRLGALEEENRTLRGKLEELTHEMSRLQQPVEAPTNVENPLEEPRETEVPAEAEASSSVEESPTSDPVSPEEDYKKALSVLEQGDYEGAESAFAAFMAANPKNKLAGAAQYWLGVTFFAREQYEKAAANFAKGHKNYPHSSKATSNLLKLAESLEALGRHKDACTTLDQLSAYPKAHAEVSAAREQIGCS